MNTYLLAKEQRVPRPPDEVFAFFEKPENLARITPPWLAFRMVTATPLAMRQGALIDYTIRVMGLAWKWRTLISAYEPPNRFVDEQLKGPYAYWHHTHTFTAVGKETLIRDEVRYRLPFGVLGMVVHALFVRRQLEAIFAYRARVIGRLFDQSA